MIVEKLGYRPLATDHAGAFIHELQIPLSRYLSYYEAAFKKVQSKKPRLGWKYRDETVVTTWEVFFEAIESKDSVASEILLMSSFLNHESIYDRFFYEK